MKQGAPTVFLVGLGLLGGCGAPNDRSGPLPTWQEPELLYLQAQPYSKLYVEIDTVEGVDVDEGALAAFREFLREHCDKPGGTEFVQGKPIPLDEAQRMHLHFVALTQMNGPQQGPDDARTAYLYVLIYDSERMGLETSRPHVSARYPCAIYFNTAFDRAFSKQTASRLFQHEAGHVLGLCKNKSHANGAHCTNKSCLMGTVTVSISRWLFGIPPRKQELCQDCLRDLALARQAGPHQRMSFRGPALVRQEKGYLVASLPFHIKVSFRPLASFDGQEMAADARRLLVEAKAKARKTRRDVVVPLVHCRDRWKTVAEKRAALRRVIEDPSPYVANWAKEELKKLDDKVSPPSPQTQPAGKAVSRGRRAAARLMSLSCASATWAYP
jgi:hypothetical protein